MAAVYDLEARIHNGEDKLIRRLRQNFEVALDVAKRPPQFSRSPEASVLVLVRQTETPSLILTVRSSQLNAHGGEVALPGGKRDLTDQSLEAVALRETEEELGISRESIEVLGPLPGLVSKHGLWVTPFVGLAPADAVIAPCEREVAAVFEVPLPWFLTDPRSATERLERQGVVQMAPVYEYEGYRIWGLTALILLDFINLALT